MKKLITTMAMITVLSTSVFAADNGQMNNSMDMKGMNMQGQNMSAGMMMDHDQMMKMQAHMTEMQKMMADIKQEKDLKKREQMMDVCIKEMDKHMNMMQMMNPKTDAVNSKDNTSDEHTH